MCLNFCQKWVGLHFWRFFHKLVWSPWQGGQIGRFFRPLGDCLLGKVFFENYRSSSNCWAAFSMSMFRIKFDIKTGWATFWAIFSQTRPITLVIIRTQADHVCNERKRNVSKVQEAKYNGPCFDRITSLYIFQWTKDHNYSTGQKEKVA
jgi:hypothetical protein